MSNTIRTRLGVIVAVVSSLRPTNAVALKKWAVICHALTAGRQIKTESPQMKIATAPASQVMVLFLRDLASWRAVETCSCVKEDL